MPCPDRGSRGSALFTKVKGILRYRVCAETSTHAAYNGQLRIIYGGAPASWQKLTLGMGQVNQLES